MPPYRWFSVWTADASADTQAAARLTLRSSLTVPSSIVFLLASREPSGPGRQIPHDLVTYP